MRVFCRIYDLKPNFYDVTMHGTIDLFTPLPHLQTSLAQDLRNRTLVILDSEFVVSATAQQVVTGWTH